MLLRKIQKSNECCLILIASPLLPTRFYPILSYCAVLSLSFLHVYFDLCYLFCAPNCFARQIVLRAITGQQESHNCCSDIIHRCIVRPRSEIIKSSCLPHPTCVTFMLLTNKLLILVFVLHKLLFLSTQVVRRRTRVSDKQPSVQLECVHISFGPQCVQLLGWLFHLFKH